MAAYRGIVSELPGLLAPDGVAILEAGEGQAEGVMALAAAKVLHGHAVSDLRSIPRAVVLEVEPRVGTG
jgi:release factor glutamine methyltransferase